MRWIQSGLLGISGWLGTGRRPVTASAAQLDAIRESMLAALGTAGLARMPQLVARIRHCHDAESLWDLRVGLMGAASGLYGEARARELLVVVTACFDGVLPHACTARALRSPTRVRQLQRH
jgi:hypothetical protein